MKTILVLTDFSKKANSAAEFALHMAIKMRANMVLCHAMEFPLPLPTAMEFNWATNKKLQVKSVESLAAAGKILEALIPNDTFQPAIEQLTLAGNLGEVTLNVLKEREIDLIVSGSHKNIGPLNFFSKSYRHSILDKIDCPVLFIPEGFQFKNFKTISYATDLSFSNAKVLPFLANLATPFEATIEVNHISAGDFSLVVPKQSIEYSLRKFLKENRPPVHYHCRKNTNVGHALLEITHSGETDILAVVHKKYDFIDGLLHNSISKHLAGAAGIPLLVLPFSFSLNNADISNDELERFCFEGGDLR